MVIPVNVISDLFGNFVGLISSIQIKDIVDIAAVAIIIYYVLKFLRDRRAGKLAFGVVFLFALQMISNLFGFVALSFLMKNIFQIGLIALVSVSAGATQRTRKGWRRID